MSSVHESCLPFLVISYWMKIQYIAEDQVRQSFRLNWGARINEELARLDRNFFTLFEVGSLESMKAEVSQAALKCLSEGAHALVVMYTDTALMLNASHLVANSYAERRDAFRLSTTQNIPADLRLPLELDYSFPREELPAKYREGVVQRICEDFLIRMISLIDGIFEDVLESVVPLVEPGTSDAEIAKKVRSAWQQDANGHARLLNYLVDEAGLKSLPEKKSTVQMAFDRYYEIREIRHALVHTGGILSKKHQQRLKEFSERLPVADRNGSLAYAVFIKTGRVIPNVGVVLGLRHWAYTTILSYMQAAFERSVQS